MIKSRSVAVVIVPVAVVLLLALAAGAVLAYAKSRKVAVQNIEAVFAADKALYAEAMVKATPKPVLRSQRISAYAKGLRAIDMSRCPREFQLAYLEHIQAWELAGAESKRTESLTGIASALAKFGVWGASGGQAGGNEVMRELTAQEKADRGVTETWRKVELIAVSYGARIPQ